MSMQKINLKLDVSRKIKFNESLLWLGVFCFFTFSTLAQTKEEMGLPFIQNFEPAQYGANGVVSKVLQGNDQLIYFATNTGNLFQYDGRTFRNIMKDKFISSLAKGDDGTIYVGSNNDFGFLQFESGKKPIFNSLKSDTVSTSETISIEVTKAKVYFVSLDAIYECNKATKKLQRYAAKGGRFFGSFLNGDQFYSRLKNTGMITIRDGKIVPALHNELFKTENAFYGKVDVSATEKILFCKTGLLTYFIDAQKIPQPFNLRESDFASDNLIVSGQKISDRHILLGSTAKGAILIDPQGQTYNFYNDQNGLQNNDVESITVDQQKNSWMGLASGLSKAELGLDLSYWDKQTGLRGAVMDIHRFNGKIYAATDQGAYYLDAVTNRWILLKGIAHGRQHWKFSEFNQAHKNILLLGHETGIYQIENDQVYPILTHGNALFVQQSKLNNTRIYSSDYPHFTSMRFENGKWIDEGSWPKVIGSVKSMIEQSDGTIWLGTYSNGIIRVIPDANNAGKPKLVRFYTEQNGLPTQLNCDPIFHEGQVLATTSKGLYKYDAATDRFTPYCQLGDRFCKEPLSAVMNPRGELTNGIITLPNDIDKNKMEIGIFIKEGNEYKWHYKPFRRLPLTDYTVGVVENDSTFWIGGYSWLFKYNPKKDRKNYEQPFRCLIRKVTMAKDSIISWGDQDSTRPFPTINYAANKIKFEFAAPFFDREERTNYAYQLKGFDQEFSPWSMESTKEYINLPEGQYTFMAKARNIYDVESDIATYTLVVLPPWYRCWWAYVLYVLGAVLSVFGLVRWQTHRLLQRSRELEKIVQKRTRDLAEKNDALLTTQEELTTMNDSLIATEEELRQNNEELAATNDKLTEALNNLRSTQTQLIESEKMASLGQLTAGIAHEINNPLNFISGGIQALDSIQQELLDKGQTLRPEQLQSLRQDIHELMRTVTHGIDRTATIVKGLLTFSNPHENEKTSVDIKERITSTIVLLNSKIKNEDVTVQLEFNHRSEVRANASQIGQVLLNVMDNAIQASEQNTDARGIWISTSEENGSIQIKIRDNGSGIPAEIQSQIFNPFFTTKEIGKGTGLGLSITYGIIQNHNGTITFTSQMKKGTEFIINLPVNT